MKGKVARPPMLVMRHIVNTDLELKELTSALAFQWGVALPMHFSLLLDMVNLLSIAGHSDKSRRYILPFVEKVALPALANIKDRYVRVNKLGVSSAEAKVLVEIVNNSKAFWARQPIELYHTCGLELKAFYKARSTL